MTTFTTLEGQCTPRLGNSETSCCTQVTNSKSSRILDSAIIKHFEEQSETRVGSRVLRLHEDRLFDDVLHALREKYHMRGRANRCFLSTPELKEIFTESVVWHILHQKCVYPDDQIGNIVSQILNLEEHRAHFQLFTILNLIGEVQYIKIFFDTGFCDEDLPLMQDSEAYNRLVSSGCRDSQLAFFCTEQWHVLVPIFDFTSGDIFSRKFKPKIRMPFLEQQLESRGGQGKIYRVEMHPNHFRAKSAVGPEFAIKQFDLDQKSLWENEVRALTTLSRSQFKDKHLIELLCAYEYEDHGLFLIFPLAKGSLSKYWKSNLSQSQLHEGPRWLLEQCTGIAGGLSKIHSATSKTNLGRHGDIKPGNILWFNGSSDDRGYLVLADFTSTRFHSLASVNLPSTGTSGITRAYCPPEVDNKPETVQTQAYDIWSLGCVYLEFLTWYLLGHKDEAIRGHTFTHSCGKKCYSFATLRMMDDEHLYWEAEDKFFNILHENNSFVPVVKGSVEKWIHMLHRSDRCSRAMHAFLELIEKSMLLVLPKDRLPVDQVLKKLEKILEEARDPEYCLIGRPWPVTTADTCHPPVVGNEPNRYNLRPVIM